MNARDTGFRVMVMGFEASSSFDVSEGRYPESLCWLASENRGSSWSKNGAKAFTFWFQDISACSYKHSFIQHHALVSFLPIQGNNLGTASPENGRVQVGRSNSESCWISPQEVSFIVIEEGCPLFLMVLDELLF